MIGTMQSLNSEVTSLKQRASQAQALLGNLKRRRPLRGVRRAIKHCAYHDHIDTYSIRAFLRIIMSIILRTRFFMR